MANLPLSWPILALMLAHLGALAHHLALFVRHLGDNMSNNSKQNAIFEPTSLEKASKMPQPHIPSTPKVQKTTENLKFFNVFQSPAMLLKSIKNTPRTTPEAPKLTPIWQSCRYHGPSYSYRAPSRSQLTANFAQASPILRPSSQLR